MLMKPSFKDRITDVIAGIIVIFSVVFIAAVVLGIGWAATCLVVKLITMCFGLTFSWAMATGIWLIILLLKKIFKITIHNHK